MQDGKVFAAAVLEALSGQPPASSDEADSPPASTSTLEPTAKPPMASPEGTGEFKGEFDLPAIAGLDEHHQRKKMAFVELQGYVQEPRVKGLGEGASLDL